MTVTAIAFFEPAQDGDGVTLTFNYTFRVDDGTTEIRCVIYDVDNVPRTPTFVSAGGPIGGTVTITPPSVAPAAGEKVLIYRDTTLKQLVNYEAGNFPSATHEKNADKLFLAMQEAVGNAGRTLRFSLLSSAIDPLPPIAVGKTLVRTDEGFGEGPSLADMLAYVAATAADRVQTGLDKTATAADAVATAADRVQTGLDKTATAADAVATAADRVQTGLDVGSTDTAKAAAVAAQLAAEAALASTLAAYDNFDDRYLGPKSADPALDNDGNALVAGTLYYNTVLEGMRLWTGTVWTATYISGAGYLQAANNLSELVDASVALTNLGISAAAKAILDDVDIPAIRATLGLGDLAVKNEYDYSVNQGTWDAGDTTDNKFITPAKLKAAVPVHAAFKWTAERPAISGSSIAWVSIPANVTEVIMLLTGVSQSASDNFLVQLGHSGGYEITGYDSSAQVSDYSTTNAADGFVIKSATNTRIGYGIFGMHKTSGNRWVSQHSGSWSYGGGDKTLSDTLAQVRLILTGAATFDLGSVTLGYK